MSVLKDILLEVLGDAASEFLPTVFLLLVIFVLSLPVYFVIKKFRLGPQRWHKNTTFREDLKEAIAWRPSAADYARSPLALELNEVGTNLRTVFQYVLGFVMIAATIFIVWFFAQLPHDSNRAFLQMYFGIGYLCVMGWAAGQLFSMQREKRSRRRLQTQARSIVVDFAPLDPAILQNAALHIGVGEKLESVSAFTNPQYSRWPFAQRRAYEEWLLSQIHGPQPQAHEQSIGQFQPVFPPQQPAQVSQSSTQPWLTAKQITIIIVVFTLALAAFTTLMFYAKISQR